MQTLLTAFGGGRLHHSLDAFAAQTAVVADAFDIQQKPIDLSPIFCKYGGLDDLF